jgi:hypothetical protein
MPNTTNFGWATPADTDLVKDGAAAIRTLGSSIDTSLVDLKGGTTGQVLTKASNTDLDFSFTTPAGSPITTEGDLVIGDASGDAVRLPIGAAGTVLTSDGDTADWVAPAGGGKVLQVVFGTQTGIKSSSSSSYADTDLTATITPSAATSKVLVIASHQSCGKNADGSGTTLQIKLMRGSTEISNSGDAVGQSANLTANIIGTVALTELDSPNTTSATTYKTQYRSVGATSAAVIGNYVSNQVARNSITLIEIGA